MFQGPGELYNNPFGPLFRCSPPHKHQVRYVFRVNISHTLTPAGMFNTKIRYLLSSPRRMMSANDDWSDSMMTLVPPPQSSSDKPILLLAPSPSPLRSSKRNTIKSIFSCHLLSLSDLYKSKDERGKARRNYALAPSSRSAAAAAARGGIQRRRCHAPPCPEFLTADAKRRRSQRAHESLAPSHSSFSSGCAISYTMVPYIPWVSDPIPFSWRITNNFFWAVLLLKF